MDSISVVLGITAIVLPVLSMILSSKWNIGLDVEFSCSRRKLQYASKK